MGSPELFRDEVSQDTGIIVVIPLYDEAGILNTLESLNRCAKPSCGVEVIIIINAPPSASKEQLASNIESEQKLLSRKREGDLFFRLLVFNTGVCNDKKWGVGSARRLGMDEAERRLSSIDMDTGLIVSLDADCTVADNYFLSLERNLLLNPEANAASIYFEHHTYGLPEAEANAIRLYELHLRYYYQALLYSHFPWVTHTVGSSMAVRASVYAKAGRMAPKQAGEDFYFIQKLLPVGGYLNIWDTAVYPSGRRSYRVPFGTGKAVGEIITKGRGGLFTYNPQAFKEMRQLFDSVDKLMVCETIDDIRNSSFISASLLNFITAENWILRIDEIRRNTVNHKSFRKRFFSWFNMFMVVRYLNHSHASDFVKIPVDKGARWILEMAGLSTDGDVESLLSTMRMLDKGITSGASAVS